MFGMGGTEILVILIVALLFLGPDKLPDAAKKISKGIRDIKKQSRALQRTIEDDEHIGGAIRDLKSALRGDEEPIRPKPIKPPKQLVEPVPPPALPEPGTPEPLGVHDEHGALVAVSSTAIMDESTHGAQSAAPGAGTEAGSSELTLRGIAAPTAPGEPGSTPAEPVVRPAVAPPARDPDLASAEPTIRGVVAPRPPDTSEASEASEASDASEASEASDAKPAGQQPKLTMPRTAGERDGAQPTAADDAELAALVKPAPHTIARSSPSPSPPSPSPSSPAPAPNPADEPESKHG